MSVEVEIWTLNEQRRVRACAKALVLRQPALMPRLGRFGLVRLIGRGAHGAVYEAVDSDSGQAVALKTLRDSTAASVLQFKREFRSLTGIVHDNLVCLHELFAGADEWYFTMELVSGSDFLAYARGGSDGDSTRVRNAFKGLVAGVRAIHEAGKLHCDLKPSNVRVTEGGGVVVLDYGLVSPVTLRKRVEAPVPANGMRGTPEYIAPELFAGSAPTRASDVYAAGVMLFKTLAGRVPASPVADPTQSCPVPPSSVATGVPADLDALCLSMLARDPAHRPELDEVEQRLAGPSRGTSRPSPAAPVELTFVGRSTELEVLRAALGRARCGAPTAVFVRGSSGIGKTALVEYFAEHLGDDTVCLSGRCYEREALPYKGFDGIIDALATYLSTDSAGLRAPAPRHHAALLQVFPALRRVPELTASAEESAPVEGQQQRQHAFEALKALLCAVAERRTVVLVADDLQWADLDSARLLLELLSPPDAAPLLYVGSYRSEDEEQSEFLRELALFRASSAPQWASCTLTVEPLDEADGSRLAEGVLRGRIPDAARRALAIAREAAGVPFFVRELARHAAVGLAGATLDPSLTDLLQSRLRALQPGARAVLDLIALAGRPVPVRLLGHALASCEHWQRELHALAVAGLARTDASGALVFHHDRVRELVSALLTDANRASCHEVLARSYERTGDAEPEWLIEHWLGAGESARAVDYAFVASASAGEKLAFNRAASICRVALELIGSNDPRRHSFHVRLGEALANAGRAGEAAEAFLAAAGCAEPSAALTLRCRALQQRVRGTDKAIFIGFAWDTYNRAFVAGHRGKSRNRAALVRLEAMATRLGTSYARATVSLMRAATAHFEGRYRDVEGPAQVAQETFGEDCVGAVWGESLCTSLLFNVIEIAGPIRRLLESAPAVHRRAIERGDSFSDMATTSAMALVFLAKDEPQKAIEFMESRRAHLSKRVAVPRAGAAPERTTDSRGRVT